LPSPQRGNSQLKDKPPFVPESRHVFLKRGRKLGESHKSLTMARIYGNIPGGMKDERRQATVSFFHPSSFILFVLGMAPLTPLRCVRGSDLRSLPSSCL
jgi:hypothetical protein